MTYGRARDAPSNAEGVWSEAEPAPHSRGQSLEQLINGHEPIDEHGLQDMHLPGDGTIIVRDNHHATWWQSQLQSLLPPPDRTAGRFYPRPVALPRNHLRLRPSGAASLLPAHLLPLLLRG